ncbi:hypothetical protein AAVH_30247 [Aphelenchoides avenae]|nr:hypothetical protein AAVH_30247 [Aphelenchus avenae]
MAERGTDIVRSVTLLHMRAHAWPLRHAVDPLGEPRRTDAPTPHSAFIKEWSRKEQLDRGETITESAVSELFVFENAKSAKKLEVFVWTLMQADDDAEFSLHYVFLLQVLDM